MVGPADCQLLQFAPVSFPIPHPHPKPSSPKLTLKKEKFSKNGNTEQTDLYILRSGCAVPVVRDPFQTTAKELFPTKCAINALDRERATHSNWFARRCDRWGWLSKLTLSTANASIEGFVPITPIQLFLSKDKSWAYCIFTERWNTFAILSFHWKARFKNQCIWWCNSYKTQWHYRT